MKLYVGNLSYNTTDATLNELFAPFGQVESARVITDRDSGTSKGFGFVEMSNSDAQKAMGALNGREIDGRAIRVNEAKPQENRNQEGRNDGRPPRRQHRRPKRSPGNNSGNGGPANAGGSGGGSEGGAPAA